MYEYNCKINRVVDGDTVDVDIDLGFNIWIFNERVRLYGIDAPESRTSDREEKIFGMASKEYLNELLPVDSRVTLVTKEYDAQGKFGRILGSFRLSNGKMIDDLMIENYHAVPYFGQSKDDIEAAHLANRKKLIESGKISYGN